jgi:hypothetical protein
MHLIWTILQAGLRVHVLTGQSQMTRACQEQGVRRFSTLIARGLG